MILLQKELESIVIASVFVLSSNVFSILSYLYKEKQKNKRNIKKQVHGDEQAHEQKHAFLENHVCQYFISDKI